jgi:hypothetical protein
MDPPSELNTQLWRCVLKSLLIASTDTASSASFSLVQMSEENLGHQAWIASITEKQKQLDQISSAISMFEALHLRMLVYTKDVAAQLAKATTTMSLIEKTLARTKQLCEVENGMPCSCSNAPMSTNESIAHVALLAQHTQKTISIFRLRNDQSAIDRKIGVVLHCRTELDALGEESKKGVERAKVGLSMLNNEEKLKWFLLCLEDHSSYNSTSGRQLILNPLAASMACFPTATARPWRQAPPKSKSNASIHHGGGGYPRIIGTRNSLLYLDATIISLVRRKSERIRTPPRALITQ